MTRSAIRDHCVRGHGFPIGGFGVMLDHIRNSGLVVQISPSGSEALLLALRRASDTPDARFPPTLPVGSRPLRGEDIAYRLELFHRVITVSIETMKIVHKLPKLEIIELEE